MSAISDQMMHDGLQPWFDAHGQQITVITGGNINQQFTATLLAKDEAEMVGEVVQDSREKTLAIFEDTSYPTLVKPMDQMRDSTGQIWRFAKRTNNPVDSTVEWEVIKLTPNDK